MKKIKPYIEMFVIIGILYGLGFWLRPSDPFFNKMHPSPYLIIVVLGAIKYGSPYGLFMGIICAVLDLGTMHIGGEESIRNVIYFEPMTVIAPGIYIALGHFVGEVVHSSIKRNEFSIKQAEERKKLADSLAGEKAELEGRYRQLEGKIAAESRSSYSFIKNLRKFDSLEPQMIAEYAVEVVEQYLKAECAEYWVKSKHKWQREFPAQDSETKIPELLLKAETLTGWANCRDYPEIAGVDGVDLALCRNSRKNDDVHAIVCADIPFTEWSLQLEDTVGAVLREAIGAIDFWNLKLSLGEVAPIEQRLKLESLRMFKNQVHRQLLTLRRSDSLSSLVFIDIEAILAKDIRVLGVISSCFRSLLRMSDGMSYVQDGGYFVLFLPDTPLQGAEIVIKKVNCAIEILNLTPHQKSIALEPSYYELTNANMLEKAFEEFGKGR